MKQLSDFGGPRLICPIEIFVIALRLLARISVTLLQYTEKLVFLASDFSQSLSVSFPHFPASYLSIVSSSLQADLNS